MPSLPRTPFFCLSCGILPPPWDRGGLEPSTCPAEVKGHTRTMEVIKGIPVAPGVVVGRAFVLDEAVRYVPYRTVGQQDVAREGARLTKAIEAAIEELARDRDRAAAELGPEPANIFQFHIGLLHDPTLIDHIRQRIVTDKVTAEYAVSDEFRKLAQRFRAMDNEVFRQKTADVLDLSPRTVKREWTYARTWLLQFLQRDQP